MTLSQQVQIFLKQQLKENHLKRKYFVQKSGIPPSTVGKLIKAEYRNIGLKTLLCIANYFKCSIDRVICRISYVLPHEEKQEFFNISIDDVNANLRHFLCRKLKEQNLNPYKLAKKCGFSETAIFNFIKENNNAKKSLGSAVTIALADYFQISLDEMVGRINPTTSDNDKPSQ
ncbi:helix-turn-helix domain-containing protein [Candidatus Tisiphia endosymbiont of Mystacides longicornis]|uniref:helix-turn-helix domain-containing protein n=1 Tax=Candidatus Tisiphia endosymbiont of Mystacides longicornis TaxID=3139330 RepID=UPI003CCB3D6B